MLRHQTDIVAKQLTGARAGIKFGCTESSNIPSAALQHYFGNSEDPHIAAFAVAKFVRCVAMFQQKLPRFAPDAASELLKLERTAERYAYQDLWLITVAVFLQSVIRDRA